MSVECGVVDSNGRLIAYVHPCIGAFSIHGSLAGMPSYMSSTANMLAMGMHPDRAASLLNATSSAGDSALGSAAMTPSIVRQARRLYIGNMPFGVTDAEVISFFNEQLRELNVTSEGNGPPVVSAQVNSEKNFAFVEFRTPEEATACMGLDNIVFRGQKLKIRRPKDYVAPNGKEPDVPRYAIPGVISDNVPNTPHKLYIGGLPSYLNEEQVMELLKTFGELRAFHLVRDPTTGASKVSMIR
jgi:splicing factor U2AF subunit